MIIAISTSDQGVTVDARARVTGCFFPPVPCAIARPSGGCAAVVVGCHILVCK